MTNTTKLDLITGISRENRIELDVVRLVVETFFQTIGESLSRNERLEIRGFGSFYMKKRKAKLVRNPQKPQDTKQLPERWTPVLRFSKEFRTTINRPYNSPVEKMKDFYFVSVYRDFVDTEIEDITKTLEELIRNGAKNIAIDFDKVHYVYSPGLSCLIKYDRQMKAAGGLFYVVNVKPNVMRKFESVKLDHVFMLYSSRKQFETENNLSS